MIDVAGRFSVRFAGRREHVIERGSDALGMGCVRLVRVVDHLVFVPERRVAGIENKVFEAAVARRRLFPVPLQLELFELSIAENITATPAEAVEPTVLDVPTFSRKCVLPEAVPAVRRGAVEEQRPAGAFFICRELVGWGPLKQGRGR